MNSRKLLLVLVFAIPLALATAGAALAQCPGPPWNAWPSGPPQWRCSITMNACTPSPDNCPAVPAQLGGPQTCRQRGTNDQKYIGDWCFASSSFQPLWDGLHLDESDWDEGFGAALHQGQWIPLCGVDDHLTRLLNGAHLVREVQRHAGPYGFHRWIADPDSNLSVFDVDNDGTLRGLWWLFTESHEPDEWIPSCDNEQKGATNWTGFDDDYVELHRTGAYRTAALNRAGLIVHETVHEDVAHLDPLLSLYDTTCESSCDNRFGRYNATTMQIHFLYDAATTYELTEINGQPVRLGLDFIKSGTSERWCRFNPTFSTFERNQALNSANRLFDKRFVFGPTTSLNRIANATAADNQTRAQWRCEECDPSRWTYDPSVCEQEACNEILAPSNAAVNAANAAACAGYSSAVAAGGNSQEAIDLAMANLTYQACHTTQTVGAVAYCNARKANATHVSQIDPCGWLEGFYEPGFSKSICIQQFCHEQFEADHAADGAAQWSVNGDPHGCLAAICAPDGEKCNDDLSPAECRQLFIAAHGHPSFYSESCTIDGCKRLRAQCVSDKLVQNPNAWEYPAPVPTDCKVFYEGCKAAQKAAMTTFLSLKDLEGSRIPDTGPVERVVNPGLMVQNAVADYRDMLARGAGEDELESVRQFLVSEPEMLRALFELAPGRFVALFGKAGFEEFIGPGVELAIPQPIAPSDLTPEGRRALEQLEALIESAPPEELAAPFGRILSQRRQLADPR